MNYWRYIELDDGIGHGRTADGLPFWEMEIQGWNDDVTFTDLTDLVAIRAVLPDTDSEAEISVAYAHPELQQDLMIGQLVTQAIADLRAAASAFRQAD
ncbi:hypothetical protein ACSFXN_18285 [Planococcus sp. 1R117A]|uniref:hypothetical protein n=1 Tax=Planococcus sp. 1R117A TaxID=3447020 RepID=UPI003EDBFE13